MDSLLAMSPESLASTAENHLPVPLKKFYQGEPLALGITQIFIGIIGIIFGILISFIDNRFMYYIMKEIPYWSGVLYIISGSLAVAAARNPKTSLVKGMLAMNVISAITAGVGIILLTLTIMHIFPVNLPHFCDHDDTESQLKCFKYMISSANIFGGILAVLIVFAFVESCLALFITALGYRVICRNDFTETVVIVYQNVTPANAQRAPVDCNQSESPGIASSL